MSITFLKQRARKKAIMGIETLIIFIAMIIVAAIAAGVLLRTQGVLQQRALAVGSETRERLVTGVEILSVVGLANASTAEIHQFEFTTRLQAGSSDVQLLTLSMTITTRDNFFPFSLQDPSLKGALINTVPFLNGTQTQLANSITYDPNDNSREYVQLVTGSAASDGLSALNITYMDKLGNIVKNFQYALGINFTNTSQYVNLTDAPIYENTTDEWSRIYGFVTLWGHPSGTSQISTSQNFTKFQINSDSVDADLCDWTQLVPDYRFCYRARLGNTNTLLESGEVLTLRIKTSSARPITIDQQMTVEFIPKGGSIQEILVYVPQVINQPVLTLWP